MKLNLFLAGVLAWAVPTARGQVMSGATPNAAYSPLQLWLQAGAGVASGGNGTAITSWTNLSASPFSVGNATPAIIGAANAPTYVAASSALNGQPALAFNGTNQGLDITNNANVYFATNNTSALLAESSYTVFAVVNTAGPNTASPWDYVQMLFANNYNTMYLYTAGPWVGAPVNQYLDEFCLQNSSFANWAEIDSSGVITNNLGYVLSTTCVGTNAGCTRLYINGVENDNATPEIPFVLTSDWNLGYQTGNTRWFHGQIAEMLVYQAALADADRAKVTAYLGAKYGIGVAQVVSTPTNNPPAGIYSGAQSVTISSDTGSMIFYTTDGSNPTNSATRRSGRSPIAGVTVPAGTNLVIMAYATNAGATASTVAKAIYNTIATNAQVTIVSEVLTQANGKRALYVDGKPFQAYGGQMRVDTWRNYAGYTDDQMAALNIFSWASNLNMNVVQVPIYWSDIERTQNTFTWTNLTWAIGQCYRNGLRMEILWFGTDISGPGGTGIQPGYVLNDSSTYPLMVSSNGVLEENQIPGADGTEYTVCKEYAPILTAENNALFNMLGYLQANDSNHVVIGLQVEDEQSLSLNANPPTDRCYCPVCNALYAAGSYSNALGFCKQRLAVYLNNIAAAAKLSPYKLWTRVNWVSDYWDYDEDVGQMRSLGTNVDFIAWDPYDMSQGYRYYRLAGDLSTSGNLPYLAEEPGGEDGTCRQKIIDTLAANGGGCNFYRVDTYTTNDDVDNYLINPDGSDARPWTDEIRQTFGMLGRAMSKLVGLAYTNNASSPIQFFNSYGDTATSFNGTNLLNGAAVQYGTTAGGVGVAFADGANTVLMSAKSGTFTLSTGPGVFENGYYDTNGNWVAVSVHAATNNDNGTMTVHLSPSTPYEVVRFRLAPSLAITSLNGGSALTAGAGFNVVVQALDTNGAPLVMTNATAVTLSLKNGSGTLGGTLTGTIPAGSSAVALSGVTYSKAESGVMLTATATSGESLVVGDSVDFTVGPGAAAALALAAGNSQAAFVNRTLPAPFVVQAADANGNAVPVAGVTVSFGIASVPAGASGQSLSTTAAVTGANGQVASTLTLGNTLGTYTVTASAASLSGSPVTFTAAAVAPLTKAGTGINLAAGSSWTGGAAPTSSSTAYWGASSLGANLTLGSAASWGGLTVSNALTSITITGAGPLTLGAGGINMSASSVSMTLGIPIVLGANQTWKVNGGETLSVSGGISGAFGLTKAGAGTLSLSGTNTYTGPTIISGGTLALVCAPMTGSSLWLDGTRGVTTSGGLVTEWADQSGNGRNATPGTAPTVGNINGVPAISFDGASQGLNIDASGLLTGTNESVFVVAQNENFTNAVGMLLCEALNGNASAGVLCFASGAAPSLGLQKNQPNWDEVMSAQTFGLSPTLCEMVRSGTNAGQTQLYLDTTLDSASNAVSALTVGDHLNVGYQYDWGHPQRWFAGQIGEVLVYPRALSTADRQTVENYLSYKWLGSGLYGLLSPSSSVQIAAGATFDVSGLGAWATYTLGSAAGLSASGTGMAVGTTAAAIKGGSNGVVSLGSRPITLTFDGAHPALYMAQGTLSLAGNAFTINTVSPLAAGTYTVMQQAGGAIAGSGTFSVAGTAFDGSHQGYLQISGPNLNLVVTNFSSTPAISSYTMGAGGPFALTFTGVAGWSYRVLSTNTLSAPLAGWPALANGVFAGSPVIYLDTSATNAQRFYRLASP
jgi:autotransporter-associated beta strand protein